MDHRAAYWACDAEGCGWVMVAACRRMCDACPVRERARLVHKVFGVGGVSVCRELPPRRWDVVGDVATPRAAGRVPSCEYDKIRL